MDIELYICVSYILRTCECVATLITLIVGVADPIPIRMKRMQSLYEIPGENVFSDWSDFIARDKFADVVIITTQDRHHKKPAVACADKGYHILLEKPMAVTEEDCQEIVEACERNSVMLSVCLVFRYQESKVKIKEIIESGAIGKVVNIQHTEPVGYFHFAHSYVRGNWRAEKSSAFSLLTKSCHDIDLIYYWMGNSKCTQVSSFGSLNHFRKENKPVGAGYRCSDCSVEGGCPYSAKKIYMDGKNPSEWPTNLITDVYDIENVTDALKNGPYGRCVYECDNDVCDNQVVNFTFEGGRTASFTMVAFTEKICESQTRIFGTKGEITCDGFGPVYVYDFNTGTTSSYVHSQTAPPGSHLWGHGCSDYFLMDAFIRAVSTNDASYITTGPHESLNSHRLTFAAEQSRRENRVVTIDDDIACSMTRNTNVN
ncbi:putative oxidoreductase YteT isoform X2 [Ptychodera flava]|uniref:putative oxidoreductase YteT isoform X2 n=1 Tax=Ptychodera flava TaxID=63121 RepID=UPI00396A4EC8